MLKFYAPRGADPQEINHIPHDEIYFVASTGRGDICAGAQSREESFVLNREISCFAAAGADHIAYETFSDRPNGLGFVLWT
jgi:hypothetical protein